MARTVSTVTPERLAELEAGAPQLISPKYWHSPSLGLLRVSLTTRFF